MLPLLLLKHWLPMQQRPSSSWAGCEPSLQLQPPVVFGVQVMDAVGELDIGALRAMRDGGTVLVGTALLADMSPTDGSSIQLPSA